MIAGSGLPGPKAEIKAYVTALDHLQYTQLAEGMVQINVTHSNLKQFVQELRLDLRSTIGSIKERLYTFNGSNIGLMELQLRDESGNFVCTLNDDSRPLGFYGVRNGMEIHVKDNDPFSLSRDGGLDNVALVKKWRMTDEEYDKREKTYRAWKREQLRKDPNWAPRHIAEARKRQEELVVLYSNIECIHDIKIGLRCSVSPGDRRGEVCFIGMVDGLAGGYWIGVKLDEPLGRNDGSINGRKYFDADPNCGVFARPDNVKVGDYPNIFEEEMGDILKDLSVSSDESKDEEKTEEKVEEAGKDEDEKKTASKPFKMRRRGQDSDDDDDYDDDEL